MGKKLDLAKAFTIIKSAVRIAEFTMPGATGAQKKQWVVDFVNDRVDIPLLGEKLEAAILSVLIDTVVALFNEASEKWEA